MRFLICFFILTLASCNKRKEPHEETNSGPDSIVTNVEESDGAAPKIDNAENSETNSLSYKECADILIPLLKKHCLPCHSGQTPEATLTYTLEEIVATPGQKIQLRDRIAGVITGSPVKMPPTGSSYTFGLQDYSNFRRTLLCLNTEMKQ